MSKLLIDESPLQVIPSLATKIGLNEAIALQQLHYWLNRSGHLRDGVNWYYRSAQEWREDFPFWSRATCQRVFISLEEMGLIRSGNYNKLAIDRTKWYTINYETVARLESGELSIAQNEQSDDPEPEQPPAEPPIAQNEQPSRVDEQPLLENEQPSRVDEQPLPETSTEISTETAAVGTATATKKKSRRNGPVIDPNFGMACSLYEQQIGILNGTIAFKIREDIEGCQAEWITKAFERAALANKNRWDYIRTILAAWKANGGPDTKPTANAPNAPPPPERHETWIRNQSAPGESLENTFERLKSEGIVPPNAIIRRSTQNGNLQTHR